MDANTRLEGFLLKRGKVARGWKKRWFQLGDRDYSRLYYSEEKNSEKLGYIDLKVSEVRASKADSFVVEVSNADRTFQLQAANEVQFQSWLEFLRRCTREAASNTEPLQQEVKRLLRVIHELSEERRLALELTSKLNEELAASTSRMHDRLATANQRIAALEAENAQLRRANGDTRGPETSAAPVLDTQSGSTTGNTRLSAATNGARASMRKTLRRTLELKRDEMRMASKQRLLDIENEVGTLLDELNLLHDVDSDEESEHGEDSGDHEDSGDSGDHEQGRDESSPATERRPLKKSNSEMNMKELKHRVQSSSHQTAAIVDKLSERAMTVAKQSEQQRASADHATETKTARGSVDSQRTSSQGSATRDTNSVTGDSHQGHADGHATPDTGRSDSPGEAPAISVSASQATNTNTSADHARPRIDSQAPGAAYVAERVKSARTKWLTRDSMLSAQPVITKPKAQLKRIDTAPSHSFVKGVPRANTKSPVMALNSPRGINQPQLQPSMLSNEK